jgi:hypothetical protein
MANSDIPTRRDLYRMEDRLLRAIESLGSHHHKPRGHFGLKFGPPQNKRNLMQYEQTINNTQKLPAVATKFQDDGSPPTWAVTSGNSTVEPDPSNPDAVFLRSEDDAGDTTFSVSGTRGGNFVTDTVLLHVTSVPPEDDFGVTFGAAIPKNPPVSARPRRR